MEKQMERILKVLADGMEKGVESMPDMARIGIESIGMYYMSYLAVGIFLFASGLALFFALFNKAEYGHTPSRYDAVVIISGIAIFFGFVMVLDNIGPALSPLGYILSKSI